MPDQLQPLIRAASSFTLMMMGFDAQLDKTLKELRQVLRARKYNEAKFIAAMAEVEKQYDKLEGMTDSSMLIYANIFEIMLEDKAAELLKPLRQEQPLLGDLLRIAEPLSRHISQMSHKDSSGDESLQQELRSRLGSRFKALLQTMVLMGESKAGLMEFISQLNDTPSWELLEDLANKTIEALQSRLHNEKRQLESYLSELNAKLSRINEIVSADSNTLSELKQINEEFNASINEQMLEAREKIDQQDKISALKTDLLESLDSIAQRLQNFHQQSEQRLQSMQENRADMNKQIQALKAENLELVAALDRERKISMIDALTQLPNRLGFDSRLNQEVSRALRYEQPISIAIIDIDFFKSINDKFGHLVGDKVLRMTAKEMKRVSRGSDFLARYGGEEFVLILPQTSQQEAVLAVEKIRSHIENCPFHYQSNPVPLTVSIGVAELADGENIERWINRADTALYHSKNTGRNKVSSANPDAAEASDLVG